MFFNGRFYVWCSKIFCENQQGAHALPFPPSSNPSKIYSDLRKAVDMRDVHDPKIKSIKLTLKRVARKIQRNGEITDTQYRNILDIIKRADISDFKPLIYIIPYQNVLTGGKIKRIPPKNAANPLSEEYRIEDLNEEEFEVIDMGE